MKIIFCSILAALIFYSKNIAQDYDYWESAIAGEKIYTIFFFTDATVIAISTESERFTSTNNGITWKLDDTKIISEINTSELFSSMDIHCAIIHTTDSGKSWYPYSSGKQEHFCRVYLRDPNVGYQTAFEFLSKITSEINDRIKSKDDGLKLNAPQQCTEYYTNETEGWALGWCVKNFVRIK
ncbi:MAG: hypothetical protein IPM56_06370 [Ignavibacteriales bacterium]|nr:MAG: hypothetical protein IPM56_06370 [Ignavibacteriales bacterium]